MQIDQTKSRVTREAIGLLLYGIYPVLKSGEDVAVIKFITDAQLPAQPVLTSLKQCSVLENLGKGRASKWRWKSATGPTDAIIEKVFNHYHTQLSSYITERQKKIDKKNGVDRANSGAAHTVGVNSIYLKERIEILDDKLNLLLGYMDHLFKEWGVKKPGEATTS